MEKKKIIIISSVIFGILVFAFGITYALYTYNKIGKNSKLVVGDIYMHYDEVNQLIIDNAIPSDSDNVTKYFEFTIDGKNTTTDRDIEYDLKLVYGDDIENRNRIRDNLLKFKLIKITNGNEEIIFDNQTYEKINNQIIHTETIPKNTTSEIKYTYRLYMWISNDINVCAGDANENCDYYLYGEENNWNDLFASVKINATGVLLDKNGNKPFGSLEFKELLISKQTDTVKTYVEEDGVTYVSGAKNDIDFNYVWYSGKLWRIVAVNEDNSLKMITDDIITTITYGEEYEKDFYNIEENKSSYIYQWLNEDFLDTLYNYENIIVTDSTWNVTNANVTSSSDFTLKLPSTTIINNSTIGRSTPVGLLNSYEYYLSYKNIGTSNGYLNNGYYWWLSNLRDNSYTPKRNMVSFTTDEYGITADNNDLRGYGVRPVINLLSSVNLVSGDGTKNNPYKIFGDKEQATANTTYLNTRTSGEYVRFDNELYRIVDVENGNAKINKVDYLKDTSGNFVQKQFSTTINYGSGTRDDYLDYYLNNTWYNSLTSKNMIQEGTYYLGSFLIGGYDKIGYKATICVDTTDMYNTTTKNCEKTSSIWEGYIALPRVGEMFASQQGNGEADSKRLRLLTPGDNYMYHIFDPGQMEESLYGEISETNLVVRPSFYLKSNVVITGGNGTKNNPFTITLK